MLTEKDAVEVLDTFVREHGGEAIKPSLTPEPAPAPVPEPRALNRKERRGALAIMGVSKSALARTKRFHPYGARR
jgi:hypothetical protein